VGLTEGSLIAIFRDAAEFAGGVNDLIELGKTVANVLGGALGGMGAAALFRRKKKKVGVRTVESLAKIAAASESHVQLRYKGVEGDRLFVEVTPSQARQMQKLIAEAKDLAATSSTETDKRAVAEDSLLLNKHCTHQLTRFLIRTWICLRPARMSKRFVTGLRYTWNSTRILTSIASTTAT
jgi:hypothetical protein